MSATPKDLDASLTKLSINPQPSKSSSAFRKKQQVVAESWEDEEESSGSGTDRAPLTPHASADYPSAPPPTPISPTHHESSISPYGYGYAPDSVRDARGERANARPEKTDAVAKRMIAGALGVKAPKKTEEQRAYDRAIKEKELKRRNAEKESVARAKEEAERAKAAIWED